MTRAGNIASVAALTLCMAAVAGAQDTSRAGWRGQSFVGSSRVALDIAYQRLASGGIPVTTWSQGSLIVAPMVHEHWQIGVNPSWFSTTQRSNTAYSGSFAALVNYLLGSGEVSRPYVGVYLAEASATHQKGIETWGGQMGWLHFLSPAIAFRAELQLRHSLGQSRTDAILTLNPFLFGRANEPIAKPGLGVFDATVLADMEFGPSHVGYLISTLAPFITSWLQVGGSEQLDIFFDESQGARDLDLFSRGYIPISTRAMPFAEVFTHSFGTTGESTVRSHGERAGVRTYLAPGVALDVALQWRDYAPEPFGPTSFRPPEDRLLHISLVTQFRAAWRK